MKFDDKLADMFDKVEVPAELLPQNIALMIKAKSGQSKMAVEYKNIKSTPSIAAQRHKIIMRTASTAAACAVFALGMLAYNKTNPDEVELDPRTVYEAITPESYGDLKNIYTEISLDNTGGTENTNTDKEPDYTEIPSGGNDVIKSIIEQIETGGMPLSELSEGEYSGFEDERVSKADSVKTDGVNLYCISDGMLYVIKMETMEIIAEIEHSLNPPVEIYVEDDVLILISRDTDEVQIFAPGNNGSENTAIESSVPAETSNTYNSESGTDNSGMSTQGLNANGNNGDKPVFKPGAAYPGKTALKLSDVIVEFYDISDKTTPQKTASYKQNGGLISSEIIDGVLYTVSDYSDYRTIPLGTKTSGDPDDSDLESFVPAYYINGEKHYIAAGDIIVPNHAGSTDYTVVSAIGIKNPAGDVSVKAVLGSGEYICSGADTVYIAGSFGDSQDYSVISSFSLDRDNTLVYKAGAAVEGIILNNTSMNVYDGMLRIASGTTGPDGSVSTSLYVLDESLTVIQSAGQLLPGKKADYVRFEKAYASLFSYESNEPLTVIDLSASPPVEARALSGHSSYLHGYSDDKLIGISVNSAENGNANGFRLSMYDAGNGLLINDIPFAENLNDIKSNAFTSRRTLFIDSEKSLIGAPVYSDNEFGTLNQYYIFSYDDTSGFNLKGVIEYNDIDDSFRFIRALVQGDVIYVIGNKRIVSARITDLKVINTIEF